MNTFMIQMIDHKTGARTEPVVTTAKKFADALQTTIAEKGDESVFDNYILMVGTVADKQLNVGRFPLHTVKTFLSLALEEHPENV